MKAHAIAATIDPILDQVEFTTPVTMDDLSSVYQSLRDKLPREVSLDVQKTWARDEVTIEARVGGQLVCSRMKKVLAETPDMKANR